jgi:hypothetical protein
MSLVAFWAAMAVNILFATTLLMRCQRHLKQGLVNLAEARKSFSMVYPALGLVASVTIFFWLLGLFDAATGHGELVIAVPLLYAVATAVITVIGRVVLGWKKMRW